MAVVAAVVEGEVEGGAHRRAAHSSTHGRIAVLNEISKRKGAMLCISST